ncbi:MAG TPA: hypothetical protein VED37_07520 [Ktedonobacteraceae bacterium]|nr:hypothetical protein [Ktedonobacteraceae bacterium]
MRRIHRSLYYTRTAHRKHFSPLILIGAVVSLAVALVGAGVFVLPHIGSHAAEAVNGDCTLIVPPNPLTAQGLATPYQLTATDPDQGPCNESNPNQAVFVQGAVFDPATGKISIYNPLVIDKGTQPAIAPVVPQLPPGSIVALWGGGNDNNTTLRGTQGSLRQGHCVNGVNGSIFGQVWYCNAPAFFKAANQAIAAGKLVPPPLGKAKDGLPCPTVRDFSVVDQDQSDNVTADYLVTATGQTAQVTTANIAALPDATKAANGSDNRLLDSFIDPALGCTPWMAPDLADPGKLVPAQPLNELQAAASQANPIALVPGHDPMVLVNNKSNLDKTNAYRIGVDQPLAPNLQAASTRLYCTNLLAIAPQRFLLDAQLTKAFSSPDPAAANTLFTFLAQRFVVTYGAEAPGLNCKKLIGSPDPISVKTDADGVAVDATIKGTHLNTPIDCSINGTLVVGCSGTATINGQTCSFVYVKNAHQVKITCPATQ